MIAYFILLSPSHLTLMLSISVRALKALFGTYFTRAEVFKASALWADALYKSKCPSVRVSVCVSVCVSVHF